MYSAKILLDSITPGGARLTTWELTYPRIVHAELMTHRVFSRCSASSRAIPIEKMIAQVNDRPMLPKFWGKNKAGMQAEEELTGAALARAQAIWLEARSDAVYHARHLEVLGVEGPDKKPFGLHKQISNRLIEPWMFITVIVSSTSFSNWFKLRHSKLAQPEIGWLAGEMFSRMKASVPTFLPSGQWHMPFLPDRAELEADGWRTPEGTDVFSEKDLRAISAGRVARVSYLNHHGERDPFEDRKLCVERLVPAGHWSPLEHVAMSMGKDEWNDHVMRTILSQTAANDGPGPREGLLSGTGLFNPMALGNLVGWLQYRKCFDHESGFDFDWQNMPDPYRIEQVG